ncbi:MAG: phenylalanine--tRNA ligase subunit alpha [Candidatus Porifericomitaceae bacterium WSBS_2022_MAG_OTU9]
MDTLPDELKQLRQQALDAIATAADAAAVDECKSNCLGRKSTLNTYLRSLGSKSPEQRPAYGNALNLVKQDILDALRQRRDDLRQQLLQQRLGQESIDISLPGRGGSIARRHPVSLTLARASTILNGMGFSNATGPEIENEEHNFTALNIPQGHPARAMHDTFYLSDGNLLRTHTSPVQIRYMREHRPPLRMIAAGRVYRRDQDMTHAPMFCQLEGLMVDHNASFAELKGVLFEFIGRFFENKPKLRFRPSYFPFTEPSAEVDLWDGSKWLEVLGCGMVHQKVLLGCDVDPQQYTGFAFGMGIERMAMLRYGISDLHLLYENDIRFLAQFSA